MMVIRRLLGLLLLLLGGSPDSIDAQTVEDKVDEYVRRVSEGRYGEIRKEMPGSTIEGGTGSNATGADATGGNGAAENGTGDPGMIYVEGLIAPDGTTSIRLFRFVADSLGARSGKTETLARMAEVYARMDSRREKSEAVRTARSDHPEATYTTTGYIDNTTIREAAEVEPDSLGRIVAIWAIQVGAFKVFDNAVRLKDLLRSKGFNAVIYDNLIDGKNLLHLVWVGRYDKAEDARPEVKKIEELTGLRGVLREQMIWRRW